MGDTADMGGIISIRGREIEEMNGRALEGALIYSYWSF
jgi:hypothetical protein